ncbi:MAG: hypothetical protein WCF90_03935 [Methanomicrobiales archaeon]
MEWTISLFPILSCMGEYVTDDLPSLPAKIQGEPDHSGLIFCPALNLVKTLGQIG